ncbi:MAG TPA: DUF2892 domain-containing protein [Caulifigura sp.]|nr:DUF2892 domain-containing protein [Caulifigura sp.]
MHAPPFVPHQTSLQAAGSCPSVNVGMNERLVSLGTGALFLLNSLVGPKRSRPLSFLVAAGLLYRGYTGHCHAYEMLGVDSAQTDRPQGAGRQKAELE